MKLLVIGSGGREHALVRTLAREYWHLSGLCARKRRYRRRRSRAARSMPALSTSCIRSRIASSSISPSSAPSCRSITGLVDRFRAAGHRIFGPERAAAQLECSKSFAKTFMTRHGIPTARFRVCDSADDAHAGDRAGRARPADRDQSRRPRRRQGRRRCRDARRGGRRDSRGDGGSSVRRCRCASRARGVPERSGSLVLRGV